MGDHGMRSTSSAEYLLLPAFVSLTLLSGCGQGMDEPTDPDTTHEAELKSYPNCGGDKQLDVPGEISGVTVVNAVRIHASATLAHDANGASLVGYLIWDGVGNLLKPTISEGCRACTEMNFQGFTPGQSY